MNGHLADASAAARAAGHDLVRAHPRPDRLHLELADDSGARVVGQWLPDAAVARDVARETEAVAPGLTRLHEGRLLLQHAGADRRLRALPGLVAGGALVVHRPERRAVVRTTDAWGEPVYTKVVRPRRTDDLVRRMGTAAAVPGLRAPRVLADDPERGTVVLSTLPGRTLHDLLACADGPPGETARAVGAAVRTLHVAVAHLPREVLGLGATVHDLEAEVTATRGLIDLARTHRALPHAELAELDRGVGAAAAAIVATGPPRRGLLHRDLHDKQLLVAEDGVGVLDVDMLAVGDPALDLGNLLAHLDLRAGQGHTSREVAVRIEGEVLAGYAPDSRTREAAAGYRALTAARLGALYAFRPGDRPAGGL